MRAVRFQPVFTSLMGLAALSAFVIPGRFTDRAVPQFQMLFAPVAWPARGLAAWATGRAGGVDLPPDGRPGFAIRAENDQLIQENIWLRQHLEELQRLNGEREKLGDLRSLCTPIKVVGNDAGVRESLAVAGSSLDGMKDGMYVVYSGGIVGKLQRSGVAGGQVQLITNPGFRFTAYLSGPRRVADADGATRTTTVRLNAEPVLVEGAGRQRMVVTRVKASDAAKWGVQPADAVVLDDPEWPPHLRGKTVGRVKAVTPDKANALFVEIQIAPTSDLLKLREVMVLTKGQ